MRFADDLLRMPHLVGALVVALLVLVVAAVTLVSGLRRGAVEARVGAPALVTKLVTHDATHRRAWKAALALVALVAVAVALARPQVGRGTRVVPATTLDVVVVLDFSKSMYARDVAPSRIARAKAEVSELVRRLPGARFAAVAFAGEPMSFPLTSDGAAIAQFFRQLEPNDMPVGGTATARALERARELFSRDPKSKDHVRVIVLVTDGEDLEGDPVSVARGCAAEGTRIDVVQIGGRLPEPIPDVGPDGHVLGMRQDDSGRPLTTFITSEGEAQLASLAQLTGGKLVRGQKGQTGIPETAQELRRLAREDLTERVETVFADVYRWPLGLALALLVVEAFLAEAPRRLARLAAPLVRRRARKEARP